MAEPTNRNKIRPSTQKERLTIRKAKELYGHALAALDGDIGHVKDFYFDDQSWTIRYLVADTGSWLSGRLVLLAPHAFGAWDEEKKTLEIRLHKKRIENSPSIETHKPVSRQYEIDYYRYYGWPVYWGEGDVFGFGGFPVVLPPSKDELEANSKPHRRDDKHLRSAHAITGYHVHATDGVAGHVGDFLVDDQTWAIRDMVVEAGHWYAGKDVLITPGKIGRIDYESSSVFVNLSIADIRQTAEDRVVQAGTGKHQHANPRA